jgi:hypothetical protein
MLTRQETSPINLEGSHEVVVRSIAGAWRAVPNWQFGQFINFISDGNLIINLTDKHITDACQELMCEKQRVDEILKTPETNVVALDSEDSTLIPRNRRTYLKLCKITLEPDDYEDVLEGVMDVDYYLALETDLKDVVDAYYSYVG